MPQPSLNAKNKPSWGARQFRKLAIRIDPETHYRASLKRRPTNAEIVFGNYLHDNNIRFIFQKGFFVPFHRIADFYIPKRKIIFEIDGSVHDSQKTRDANKDRTALEIRGIQTVRFTNDQVLSGDFKMRINRMFDLR